jgi:L-fuconolactonase
LAFYRPYLDVVWNAFGDDRVIYGSNWPVSEKASDYATLQRIYLEYASEKGEEATRKFCAPNSKKAYAWAERAGRL